MKASTNRWYGFVVGCLTLSASMAVGQTRGDSPAPRDPFAGGSATRGYPSAAQNPPSSRRRDSAVNTLTDDAKAKASMYLEKGRAALRSRNTVDARYWYQKAVAQNARFADGEYSPQQLAAELRDAGVDTSQLAPAAGRAAPMVLRPSDIDTGDVNRLPPTGSNSQQNFRNSTFNDRVVSDPYRLGNGANNTAAPSRGGAFAGTPSGGAFPDSRGVNNKAAAGDKLSQARQLTAQARAARDRGDLPGAQRLLDQALSLQVPDNAFRAGETSPRFLQMQLESDLQRRGGNVRRAAFDARQTGGAFDAGNSPAQRGIYNPAGDSTRNVRVSGDDPDSSRLPPTANRNAAEGRRLIQQGRKALEAQDPQTALKFFRQAWAYEASLDPADREFVRVKLNVMQAPVGQLPRGGQTSPLEEIDARGQALRQRLLQEIAGEKTAANAMQQSDPRGALARLQKMRQRVLDAKLPPQTSKQLLTIVDRSVTDMQRYIDRNSAAIELDEANRQTRAAIDNDRRTRQQVLDRLARLVEQFNGLMEEERYPEAEIIAAQARELAPDEAIVQNLLWKSRFARRIQEQTAIRDLKEQGFYDQMTSVDRSSAGFNDNDPYQFGPIRDWENLSDRRLRRYKEGNRRKLSDAEIEIYESLKKPVRVSFNRMPLAEAMDVLAKQAGINIFLDEQGLRAEAVTSDSPVTINLTQPISVRSVLKLILSQLNLSYVVQNEVLRVTSAQTQQNDVYPLVYNVADLVIPIPNFVPSYNMGLPGALAYSLNSMGQGNMPTAGVGPLTFANNSTNGTINPAVLSSDSMLGRPQQGQQMGYGPGGLGGGVQPDFDSLIELITSTIAPDSWDEAGGTGSISGFDTNLSLVVSNTQDVHDQIADLLEQLRRLQDLQVTIEVRFITLNDNFFERIGIDFDFQINDKLSTIPNENGSPSSVFGLNTDPAGFTPPFDLTTHPTADGDLHFSQGGFASSIPQFGGFDIATAANFGFAILSDIEVFFLLQAAQGDQRSNILQAPKVTLFNGQQASISDTSQTPFVTSVVPVVGDFAAAHQPVIVVLSEGTSLNVQAVVSSDKRFVRLTLVPFFSKIGTVQEFTFNGRTTTNSGANVLDSTGDASIGTDNVSTTTEGTTVQLPTFSFTTVTTTVSVPDGGTVLLGGIKRLSEGRNERGVPMLNKLPYINRLFKNVGIGRTTQSLMMMVTPRIIIQEEEEEKAVGRPTS